MPGLTSKGAVRAITTLAAALLLWCANSVALAAPPVFKPVTPLTPGAGLRFPSDFGAHPDFKTEWWYATGWLNTADGKPLGFQVTFFRSATPHDRANPSKFAPKQMIVGHAALSDTAKGKLLHDQRNAREGFGLAYAKVGDTDVKLDDWTIARSADGRYHIKVDTPSFAFDLTLASTGPVLLQGEQGYSRKGPQPEHSSYYYSEPQLASQGTITRNGKAEAVTGTSWLDHEWSSAYIDPAASGWDWLGANLADGGALMAFQMRSATGGKLWAHATWRDATGKVRQFAPEQVHFTPQRRWRSPRTNAEYPVDVRIAIGDTEWMVTPLQDDQELDSRRSTGAVYWEGAVNVSRGGKPAGKAYLEMTGYVSPMKL